ncbi:MAG TPA: helix-turn-helix transcriptional regulator [Thermoanaerobaculia bacterium]|nr:helix-turn-helix transcriptional regulator [Thermoanaerobaculia bacterium]
MDTTSAPPLPADPTPVLRALDLMRGQAGEPLTLNDLADAAYASPYHFLRTFRRATGLSPGRFLGALRLKTAVRLLLTTDLPVTEVCFASGYNSLGTFTRRFAEVIGVPPGRLRQGVARTEIDRRLPAGLPPLFTAAGGATVPGRLLPGTNSPETAAPPSGAGLLFVGLFTANYPQGAPVACALLRAPGPFVLRHVPDGTYHLLATAVAEPAALWTSFLSDQPDLLAGSLKDPVRVTGGAVFGGTELTLRRPQPTDPPLLTCLPLFLSRQRALLDPRAAGSHLDGLLAMD